MLEKTVVSFAYIPENKLMRTNSPHRLGRQASNESSFEDMCNQKQHSKCSAKRNSRRRVEESMRHARRYSDAGSDTGSDGVAVNSGGSGRSGDWGPPILRQKQKYCRRRSENRASFTDSGISLAKTDSGDFSEISNQVSPMYDVERSIREKEYDPYSDSSHERTCRSKIRARHQHLQPPLLEKSRTRSDASHPQNHLQNPSIKRSNSCSALPSNIKPLDKHNPRLSRHEGEKRIQSPPQKENRDIEAKENAILQQCYKNEGVSSNCIEQGCCYVVDCSKNSSKFPLPERLNYPLNKYYKSESNLNRLHVQPLKKIRSSIRKLRSKTLLSTPERYEHYSFPQNHEDTIDTLDSNYLNCLTSNESSDVIMARLGKNPTSRKARLKKLFKWKLGKTYSLKYQNDKNNGSIIYSESPKKNSNMRSQSTRSIPDAIKGIFSKVHEKPYALTDEFEFTRPTETLTRASSMPSIASHRVSKQKIGDVIYFNEKGFEERENKNIFRNFFKSMEQPSPPKQTTPLKDGVDIIAGVLGSPKKLVKDAELSDGEERLNVGFENNNRTQVHHQHIPPQQNAQYYSSCQDLRRYQSPHHPSPGADYHPAGHCPCCGHSQYVQPEQYIQPEQYGYVNRPNIQLPPPKVQPSALYSKPATVVAPLDVKVSSERRAERRKICEMVFDTFV